MVVVIVIMFVVVLAGAFDFGKEGLGKQGKKNDAENCQRDEALIDVKSQLSAGSFGAEEDAHAEQEQSLKRTVESFGHGLIPDLSRSPLHA